jgi:hypothetical protein
MKKITELKELIGMTGILYTDSRICGFKNEIRYANKPYTTKLFNEVECEITDAYIGLKDDFNDGEKNKLQPKLITHLKPINEDVFIILGGEEEKKDREEFVSRIKKGNLFGLNFYLDSVLFSDKILAFKEFFKEEKYIEKGLVKIVTHNSKPHGAYPVFGKNNYALYIEGSLKFDGGKNEANKIKRWLRKNNFVYCFGVYCEDNTISY